jgi:chromosome segregation ATPase
MPLLTSVAVVAGTAWVSSALYAGLTTLGIGGAIGGAYYGAKSMTANDDVEAKEQQMKINMTKRKREKARMQIMDKMIVETSKEKERLHTETKQKMEKIDSTIQAIHTGATRIKTQSDTLSQTNIDMKNCILEQQKLLLKLEQELHEKMETLSEKNKELDVAKGLLIDKTKATDLVNELEKVKDELKSSNYLMSQKDKKILLLEKKVEDREVQLAQYNNELNELSTCIQSSQKLIDELTKQLEKTREPFKSPTRNSSFFG